MVLARIGALSSATEGWLALVAAILVIGCTVHMMRHGKRMKGEIGKRLDALSGKAGFGAAAAVFLFALLMVGREGIETATMLASMAAQSGPDQMFIGGALGVACAGLMAWAWTRYGRRVNLSRFFQVTGVFMVLFSIQLVIYAFHEFSEAGALPWLDNAWRQELFALPWRFLPRGSRDFISPAQAAGHKLRSTGRLPGGRRRSGYSARLAGAELARRAALPASRRRQSPRPRPHSPGRSDPG